MHLDGSRSFDPLYTKQSLPIARSFSAKEGRTVEGKEREARGTTPSAPPTALSSPSLLLLRLKSSAEDPGNEGEMDDRHAWASNFFSKPLGERTVRVHTLLNKDRPLREGYSAPCPRVVNRPVFPLFPASILSQVAPRPPSSEHREETSPSRW